MVQCPDSLVWELVKSNNSFMKKVNGRTKRSGTASFSVEKGNLRSTSSFRNSGLANSKAIDIAATSDNRASLSTKTGKAATAPKKAMASSGLNKSFRRVEKTIMSQTANVNYRADLKDDALAKFSIIYRANRAAKGVKKGVPVKEGRGKSA